MKKKAYNLKKELHMYKVNKIILILLSLVSISSLGSSAEENLEMTVNATAPKDHVFQGHNQYSSMTTYKGYIYIFSLDKERRPYINKIDELDSNNMQTQLIDKNEKDDYRVYNDTHHRFSIGIDEKGYIHVIGDMHHGAGGDASGGSRRFESTNPLPERFHDAHGQQMYWISKHPEDITSFTFVGNDINKSYPCNRTTYNYFRQDKNGKLYMAGRQSVREPRNHESGTLGLCLAEYNSSEEKWNMLGGIPEDGYGFKKSYSKLFKSILWEPHGYNKEDGSQWYQAYYSNIKFDENNRLHLTSVINADTIHDNATDIIYAYKDSNESFFRRADGSKIESLPMRVTGAEENRASIVLSQDKDNVKFKAMVMGLFWDVAKNPAVTFKNTKTNYRYYDKDTNEWTSKEFGLKVESSRSDHYTRNDGTIFEMGSRYEINKLQNFEDNGTVYKLAKPDRKTMSNYLLREVDKTLLLKESKLRGISIVDGNSSILTIEVP